mgnify:CR=1 FL=1
MNKRVNELLKEIRSKQVKPLYVLDGDEPYYIDLLCDAFEQHILDSSEKDFNSNTYFSFDDCLIKLNTL